MRLLISGAGVAGLALAGFLHEQGIEPALVEKATEWERVGYGIALWGNGIRILQALGLEERFYAEGERIERWTLRDAQGEILRSVKLDLDELPPLTAIHRAGLHAVLREKVPSPWIRMDTTIESLSQHADDVSVVLSDGSREEYDLVVGADGIHSRVRELTFDDWALEDMEAAVWSFWVPEGVETPSFAGAGCAEAGFSEAGFTEAWGRNGKAFLVAPVSGRHMGSVAVPLDESYHREEDLAFLRSVVHADEWLLPEVLETMDDLDDVFHDRLYQVEAAHWQRQRAVLIGDAAHALHPIVGMGASLALEDAYVLADELSRAGADGVGDALRSYVGRRRGRVARFRRDAALTQTFTFVQSPLLRSIRDVVVRHTPFLEQYFVRQAQDVAEDLFRKL